MNILFSVKGRIQRLSFWEGLTGFVFINVLYTMLETWLFTMEKPITFLATHFTDTDHVWYHYYTSSLILVQCVLSSWLLLAICAKRWHDLNYPGWLALLNVLPIFVLGLGTLGFLGQIDRLMIRQFSFDTTTSPYGIWTDARQAYQLLDPGYWHFFLFAMIVVIPFIYLGFFAGSAGANAYGKKPA